MDWIVEWNGLQDNYQPLAVGAQLNIISIHGQYASSAPRVYTMFSSFQITVSFLICLWRIQHSVLYTNKIPEDSYICSGSRKLGGKILKPAVLQAYVHLKEIPWRSLALKNPTPLKHTLI